MPKSEIICSFCGRIFLQWLSQRRSKLKFCSRQCKYEWNKTLVGYWKGKKIPLSARKNMSRNHADVSGKNNPRWKGGRRIDKDGYILIWKPDHPYTDYHGYVREHRLVMEKYLEQYLMPTQIVHHINHNKQDNNIKNLLLLNSSSEHQKYEWKEGTYDRIFKRKKSKRSLPHNLL